MSYKSEILSFLKEFSIGSSTVLDIASGPLLRHAVFFTEIFDNVFANDREWCREKVESLLELHPSISMIYCDFREININERFDLIAYCNPEMLYYSFFIDNLLPLKRLLKSNGVFLVIIKDEKFTDDEEEYCILKTKKMILDHKQEYVPIANIPIKFKSLGFEVIAEHSLYLDESIPWPLNLENIDWSQYPEKIFSTEEKRRLIELGSQIQTAKTGSCVMYLLR